MSGEEKSVRDNLLKAMINLDSASTVGVNHGKYGDLLTAGMSEITFARTKLNANRHGRLLSYAESAFKFYARAGDEWDSYFKYEWMREQEETIMSREELIELKQHGCDINFSRYRPHKDAGMFYVPFKTCLSLNWEAAGTYVVKMKRDVAE